jgi:SNF2 family DNA or RNA helicase
MEQQEALSWLSKHVDMLEKRGVQVIQHDTDFKINFNTPTIELVTEEAGDWFNIRAVVMIGTFRIPFIKFRSNIIKGKRDYLLPDGSTAILPESWFTDYRHLVEVAEERDGENIAIRKYQAGVLSGTLSFEGTLKKKLNALTGVSTIEEQPLPKGLNVKPRAYQRKGFEWLCFLNEYKLGGILADDMGLGKTLQAITLLQREKTKEKGGGTSLVVMPTSLIYNWQAEAEKFAPELRVYVHGGNTRDREPSRFDKYDLILTTYGLVRQDIDMLKKFPFHYVILDESQIIKNPSSKTAKAVSQLMSNHRLSLTGTPVENTLTDLWSQLNFLNPGMLGSETFFRDWYVTPIEKAQDEKRKEALRRIINPFLLRRTKEQVASELPPKVEQVLYCEMEEGQQKLYDETLNAYRNYLMSFANPEEYNRNKLNILSGLQKLRQIAIHPHLVEEGRAQPELISGKFEEFRHRLREVIEKGAKVLVFSQFVKLLQIIKDDLDERGVTYAYLDGSTKDRKGVVEKFQTDESIKPFLISLKAGGVGLNLTAAEYVFILDPWWNPAVESQAIDRSHRIGQTKTVISIKFITRNSIEEKIVKLQERKSKLSADIISVEEEMYKKLELEDIKELLA